MTATTNRTIAVDPTVIPYGSKVVINGQVYVAEDCGGAIKNNRIDIYMGSHAEALNSGVFDVIRPEYRRDSGREPRII